LAGEQSDELFTPKQLQYKAKRQTPATPHQLEQLRNFRERHEIADDIAWEGLTRSEASRIMDRYYASYGR
jgi:DNA polymerase-3 subunit alpha (Gram-positive type)